jgi:hypothetical protein
MNLSPNQIFMLRMFEKGWGFKMYNNKPGSWTTYWSLRRRKLLDKVETVRRSDGNLIAVNRLTEAGRKALHEHEKKSASSGKNLERRNT